MHESLLSLISITAWHDSAHMQASSLLCQCLHACYSHIHIPLDGWIFQCSFGHLPLNSFNPTLLHLKIASISNVSILSLVDKLHVTFQPECLRG